MSKPWQDEELEILETIRSTCSTIEIQKILSGLGFERSLEGISKQARKNRWSFKDFGIPKIDSLPDEVQEAITEVLKGRTDVSCEPEPPISSSAKGKATVKTAEETFNLYKQLEEIRQQTPRSSSLSNKMMDSGMSLVICLSDFHVGKIVRDESGTIVFNSELACERIRQTPERVWSYMSPDQKKQIKEIVMLLIGDHVDGEGVYPGHDTSLEQGIPQQVSMVAAATWNCITNFRKDVPLVRIITTKGNHGKSGLSPDANFDNLFFWGLEILADLQGDKGITVKNRFGNFNTFMVQGHKGLIRHKAPVQADTASAAKLFTGWQNMHDLDMICYGHWHHWGACTLNNLFIVRNGCLPGGDDYAESFGAYDPPAQVMFGVTANELPIFCTPIRYE